MTFSVWFAYFFRLELSAVEVLVLTLVFCRGHRHRAHFVPRVALWALVTLAYSGLAALPYGAVATYRDGTAIYFAVRALAHLSSYAAACAVALFCYRETFRELLICATSGVAAQCVSSNFSFILYQDMYGWVSSIGSDALRIVAYEGLYFLCNTPAYIAVYLLFAWRRDRVPGQERNYVFLPLSVTVLLFSAELSSLVQYFAEESAALSLLAECFALLFGVFVLILNNSLAKLFVTREDLRVAEMLQYQEEKQYAQLKSSMDMINVKCHDIKHFVSSFRGRVGEEELESLSRVAESFDCCVETNNETLDVILNEKAFVCGRKGIGFVCMGDASGLSFMSAADMYSLFGNALDNAIEATENLADSERRKIDLGLWERDGVFVLNVMNYCDEKLRQENGIFKTTKEDKAYHGFGMLSMDTVAHKYGGELTAAVENGMFQLTVRLPVPADARKAEGQKGSIAG